MRLRNALLLLTLLVSAAVLNGCTPAPPPPPPAPAVPAAQVKGTLNQVMRGILFPNSNIIFDAQDKDPGAPVDPAAGASPYAGTYGGWEAVENAAIALGEAANLAALPGRSCQNGKPVPLEDETYQKGLQALRDISDLAYKTAQAKNLDAMLDVADKVTMACSTCHDVFRDRVIDGKPMAMADRCVK